MAELEQIVQRMIDAGESEANIAAVIREYEPPPPDPSSITDMASAKAFLDAGGELDVNDGPLMPLRGAGRLLTAVAPKAGGALSATGGVIEKGAKAVAKSAPGRFGMAGAVMSGNPASMALAASPYAVMGVGKVLQGAGRLLSRVTPAAKTVASAATKPKLKAPEIAAALRKEYGSAQAGRMLYGPARPGLKAAERQAAIKRLTPEIKTTLPEGAKKAIDKELAASTNDEAFAYAAKAPNAPAQSYIGEQLRAALLAKMQGR